jgi:cystathionine beta-synthase
MSTQEDYPKHDVVVWSEGLETVCTWKLGAKNDRAECPKSHTFETRDHSKKIKDSVLDCVGNTPLVRINNITRKENIECELLVKCEFMNPAGSVKDRIARRMVLDAEESGRLKPGHTLIEPTSGNTGMGLAMCAASRGYNCIITLPEKMSQEKIDCLKGLGATVIRTPTEYPFLHLHGYIGIAFQLQKELENAHVLNQYWNVGNPIAHYNETGQEIWDQCDGKVDYVFMGAGTGGTVTGAARKLKEKNKDIKIIAVDPNGSILAPDEEMNKANPAAPGG